MDPVILDRLVSLYGDNYTMADVCKGCQQRHRCASCLDGSAEEYLPPSAVLALATKQKGEEAGKRLAKGNGCVVLRDESGRAIGFMCGRGR